MKNYYLILGVKPNATDGQIRRAYRRQAKELHPDYFGRDSGPFIDLQEAYAVLSDPARRQAYDDVNRRSQFHPPAGGQAARPEPLFTKDRAPEDRAPAQGAPEPLIPDQEKADLGDLSLSQSFETFGPSFDELFDRLWRNFSLDKPEFERLRSLNVEISISPEEALLGGRARILVPSRLTCPVCRGRGGDDFFPCWNCDGSGVVVGEYPVVLTFPAGIVNNYVVEIPLDRFGITNFYLRAIFRVSQER